MGTVSLPFDLTDGLDKVWGYTPSVEGMRALMGVFAHDRALITDDLVRLRYEASRQRGMDAVYESLFPAPRQRWVDMLAHDEATLRPGSAADPAGAWAGRPGDSARGVDPRSARAAARRPSGLR